MSNIKNRSTPAPPRRRFQVTAPRTPSDREEHARFVAEINRQLALISDEIAKLKTGESIDTEAFVRKDELADQVAALQTTNADETTSEGDINSTDDQTSQNPGDPDESAQAALEGAIPTAIPPAVDRGGANDLGTTTNPVQFALSDHTHRGVTLPLALVAIPHGQTFASSSGFVPPPTPSADAVVYKRIFLLMGA